MLKSTVTKRKKFTYIKNILIDKKKKGVYNEAVYWLIVPIKEQSLKK